jgi:subtilisin family serine protease
VQFPASTVHALAVGAVGKTGEFPPDSFHATQVLQGFEGRQGYFPAKFSCFGPEVDVCAPGVAIVSSLPPDDFAAWDGTSMATPHVTGMAALVLAHHPDFKGQFQARNANRVERLFQIIKESATPMPIADATRVGVGMPNVALALGLSAAADASTGAATTPAQGDAIDVLRRFLAALSAQKAGNAATTLGTASFGLQSFNGVMPPPPSDVDNARDMLRRAGLL